MVTAVRNSYIHVVKKPVRIGIKVSNTKFSHYIFFTYTVDNIPHKGKLYVDLAYRCPRRTRSWKYTTILTIHPNTLSTHSDPIPIP